jgi:NitT/TauT family transport system substrate-binding protein
MEANDAKRGRWTRPAIGALALGLVAAILWLGWSRHGEKPVPPAPAITSVRLGVPDGIVAAPVLIARARGFFAAQHVDVTVRPYQNGRVALHAMLTGQVDVAIAGDIPIARAATERQDLAVLAEIGRSKEDRWLVAKPGAGIATSADLKGKRIGTQKKTGSHFVLDRVLAQRGLAEGDVTVIDVKVEDMAKALERGELDAFTTEHPFPEPAAQHYDTDVVELHDPEAYVLTYDLVALKDFSNRTDAAANLLRALAEADTVLHAEPGAAVDVVATEFGRPREKVAVGERSFVPGLVLDTALFRAVDAEGKWFIAQGVGTAKEPPKDLFDPRALLAARPALVRFDKGQ